MEREPENETTRAPEPLALLAPDDPGPTFEAFWREYPRSDGKPAAVTAWDKALKATTPERIMAGLAAWNAYWTARGEPEFVPWAQKWLRQQQWNATPPTVARRPGQTERSTSGPGALVNDGWDRSGPSGRINPKEALRG